MLPKNYIRLNAKPPGGKFPPPRNFIDFFFDIETGKIVAKDHAGNVVYFSSDEGGASSTDDLATSNGSAAAAAGKLGEIKSNTTFTNAVADGVAENVCPLTLTPGEWDLQATVNWDSTAATTVDRRVTIVNSGLAAVANVFSSWVATTASRSETDCTKLARVRITAEETFDVRVNSTFSAGAVQVTQAILEARRVR